MNENVLSFVVPKFSNLESNSEFVLWHRFELYGVTQALLALTNKVATWSFERPNKTMFLEDLVYFETFLAKFNL